MKRSLLQKSGLRWNLPDPSKGSLFLRKKHFILSLTLIFQFFAFCSLAQSQHRVTGTVTDERGEALIGVSVKMKNGPQGVITDADGKYTLNLPNGNGILVFTYVGFTTREVPINNNSTLNVVLKESTSNLDEVVVTGYGTQRRGAITGSVATVTSKDLERVHGGSTVSTGLAGKLPGVTFRMPDGRPGASANIQIRNLGAPLYVIDGIQQDAGQFNNLSPNDIESITILKDASAAIYGVRAANGVVVVTTKQGKLGTRNSVNADIYTGVQNWTRFPDVLTNSHEYMTYKADAEMNRFSNTSITPSELEKYKAGTEPGYQSFNWRDFVIESNAPQTSVNVNATGGTEKLNYYVSGTHLYQNTLMGREYWFKRSNLQSNITSQISDRLKVGVQINGRIETRQNPGVPGLDDYFLAKFAVVRNTPLERPYANDNPKYLNDIKHNESNWAYLNYKIAGKLREDWRVLQTNFNAEYQIPGIKGLSVKGVYSYYIADQVLNNHEYTYNAYTYRPDTDTYDVTGGSTNPWRERNQRKVFANTTQGWLVYNNQFGRHSVGATFVAERITNRNAVNWIRSVPTTNVLPLIYYNTVVEYNDSDNRETRLGYIGRVNYNFADKYYLELQARRDASYLFAPGKRIGNFPSISAGWRITEEAFMKDLLGDKSILSDLKFRASYGVLGDDRDPNNTDGRPLISPFSYLEGYSYNSGTGVLDGRLITGSADRGIPNTVVSWLRSKMLNVGADFGFLNNRLTGSLEYFSRKRSGLLAVRNDVLLPRELGYDLVLENLNTDSQFGGEAALNWNSSVGKVNYTVGGNVSYSRGKLVSSYNPTFLNSWDRYRTSTQDRYRNILWGYEIAGQFQSQDEINQYPVNIDGQGNRTLLPGDLIYKDQNGDGKIDGYDERPIGYGGGTQPTVNFGFNIGLNYKAFDFHADFSGAAGYTWIQNWETRWAFQNDGNMLTIFKDRWHRQDPYDLNSAWVPGKYPANRFNDASHSNYNRTSSFWAHNVKYFRARTIEVGYTLPKNLLDKVRIHRARVYLNAYNLFSIDNLKEYAMDPEVVDENGLQSPQNKFINVGVNLSL